MDANVIYDFQASWEAGMNAGVSPQRVPANQCCDAVNVQFRGGQPHPRPSWGESHTFQIGGTGTDYTKYVSGIFQGAIYYNGTERDYVVCISGGRVYVVEPLPNKIEVTDVTPADGGNDPDIPLCWLCQADKYLVIQDGIHTPIVLLDKTAKRAEGVNPIPVGTVMCYVNGRLWVAIDNQILAGDLIGSEDDAVLKFSEAIYLNEGGSFKLPAAQGNVVSMNYIASQDTSTGQGTLLIGGEYGWSSINGLIPRDQWKNVPIQQVTLVEIGSTGHRSVVNVNGDLWFLAHDGWRTYRQARAEITGWNQVPLSSNVRQYVDNDSPANRPFVSAVFFDNRLLCTAMPTASNRRSYHAGLLSLDFDPVSTGFGQTTGPAWDGLHVLPASPIQLVTGVFQGIKRCFCFCLKSGNVNALYEMGDDYSDDGVPISWSLTTRQFLFPDKKGPHIKCKLVDGGDIRLSHMLANSTLTINYRQDHASNWKLWKTWQLTGKTGVCTPGSGCAVTVPLDVYQPRLILPDLPIGVNSVTDRSEEQFYDAQFQLNGVGYSQIEWFRPQAVVISDGQQRSPL